MRLTCPHCQHEIDPDDLRPQADELYAGCVLISPFGRREMVTRVVDDQPPFVRVFTVETGEGYGWRYLAGNQVTATMPPAAEVATSYAHPEIRIVDLPRAATPRLVAVATDASIEIPWFGGPAAVATRIGRGPAWQVQTYPVGAGLSRLVEVPGKAQARQLVASAAAEHAKALGVAVCRAEGHHWH